MKFGKSLNNQIVETLPEWRDKFLSYKNLKKRLKQIGAGPAGGERRSKRQRVGGGGAPPAMTAEEAGFVALLDAELDKFNAFFLEKEEEYVIRQKVIARSPPPDSIDPILTSLPFILREFRSDSCGGWVGLRGCRSCRTER